MNDTLNALGQVRRRAIALLGVVFVTGGLAGIAIDRLAFRPDRVAATMQLPAGGPPFGGPPVGGGSVRMTLPPYLEALGLDSAQRAAAIAIVERVRPRIDSATRQTVPLIRAVTDSARAELEALLTPDQRERLKATPFRGGPPFLRDRM